MRIVDFRSDTKTRSTPEMRQAMATADVGDDVAGEDPTVNRLESIAAEMLGKEAAVFVTSGTQGNLIGILSHCQRGDEVIGGDKSHIIRAEGAGASVLGGVVMSGLPNDERGLYDAALLADSIHDDMNTAMGYPRTRLVALENSHNSMGGSSLSPEEMAPIIDVAKDRGLAVHVDGARLFNAAIALETPASELVKDADTVTFCLSKGLGCPVGSVLCGSEETINEARRWRKWLGSAMRQSGIVAAAGIVALDSMVERLADDHANARKLAIGLDKIDQISVDPEKIDTNLVFINVSAENDKDIAVELDHRGIRVGARDGGLWRLVTHNDISTDDVEYALEIIETTFNEFVVNA